MISYKVDSRHRRVLRYKNSVLQERYMWESQLRVGAVVSASGDISKHFLYGDSINAPEAMVMSDGTRYLFVKDVRGSILKVVHSRTGVVAQELAYDDWVRSSFYINKN